jgi:predicted RNA binding protein YcfA (HicA-like mRNA interferase family)
MKLPRDLSGDRLAELLTRFGYRITRETGSHMRLTTQRRGIEHHVTIPKHDTLKVGTLSAILRDIAIYLEMDRNQLLNELWGGD